METLIVLQTAYYLATGIWPVIHIKSFEKITGEKTDKWLVKMVGLLSVAVAITIFLANSADDVKLLGILAAAAFVAIDFYYAVQRIVAPIYFVDGLIQVAFMAGWLLVILF